MVMSRSQMQLQGTMEMSLKPPHPRQACMAISQMMKVTCLHHRLFHQALSFRHLPRSREQTMGATEKTSRNW